MRVTNNFSPAFKGIYLHKRDMNQKQINKSNDIADTFYYSDAYQDSKREVDVCFLPGKSDDKVVIKFADKKNDNFLRYPTGGTVQRTVRRNDCRFNVADWVIEVLDKFNKDYYKRPDPNVKQVFEKQTDVAKLRPDMYYDIDELIISALDCGYTEDSAELKEFVTDRFLEPHSVNTEWDRGLAYEFGEGDLFSI